VRIALFTDTYPPQVNGVARTLARLVRHAREEGHEVALVTTRGKGAGEALASLGDPGHASGPGSPARRGADEGIDRSLPLHLRLPGLPVPVYPELILPRWPSRREQWFLEAFDPEVVHCATESVLGWWGRRWALRTRRPLVTSFHTNFPAYAAGYGLGFAESAAWAILRRFHAPAFRTMAPSHDTVADLASRNFHSRLAIWSRGVNGEQFNPGHRDPSTRRALGGGADVVLLYVGRLAPEKRLPLLLQAFERVRENASVEVALVLVGGGPMEGELRNRPRPGVHLAGYLTGLELSRAYASADVFGFPSDTETFGNVVLEAMASGLPVVGVDRGGVRDSIVPGETGFRTPPGDVDAFAEALIHLVENPLLRVRMGTRGRIHAEGRTWPRILDGVLDTYREAMT